MIELKAQHFKNTELKTLDNLEKVFINFKEYFTDCLF